ncbi:hypothetical protein HDU83_003620 [Entophlyctis luteolus]|nr:hypothetical protein HDU82_008433 [Entophlyctis luteolus]KAJ3355325.1 hypothetical protein HDU83_003620 [Entophlyctis luteolus]
MLPDASSAVNDTRPTQSPAGATTLAQAADISPESASASASTAASAESPFVSDKVGMFAVVAATIFFVVLALGTLLVVLLCRRRKLPKVLPAAAARAQPRRSVNSTLTFSSGFKRLLSSMQRKPISSDCVENAANEAGTSLCGKKFIISRTTTASTTSTVDTDVGSQVHLTRLKVTPPSPTRSHADLASGAQVVGPTPSPSGPASFLGRVFSVKRPTLAPATAPEQPFRIGYIEGLDAGGGSPKPGFGAAFWAAFKYHLGSGATSAECGGDDCHTEAKLASESPASAATPVTPITPGGVLAIGRFQDFDFPVFYFTGSPKPPV